VRTPDLTAAASLRQILRRPAVAREGEAAGVAKPAPALLTRVVVPDAYLLSWAAWAIPAVRRLVSERRIECVITTSPPDSTHLVGLGLGTNRPAWLADFRDGWAFEGLREPFPTAVQRRLDVGLERRVVAGADGVLASTRAMVSYFEARYGAGGAVVPNAWDADLEPDVASAAPPRLGADRVNLVYTGTLAGIRGHDDRGLLAALRRLASEDPDTARRLRLVIAGRLTDRDARMLAGEDLAPLVQVVGALPRPAAVALQRRGDALLLITSHHKSIAHGKLFEYLASGRPILALAGDNEPARIVRETQTGEVVDPEDVEAIMRALRRVAERSLPFSPRGLERFTSEATAEILDGSIEDAISRAQARLRGR
jgi:glycosyltransferase involved in cell wall biosynthesis